jgi:hypothetical protein
MAIATDTPAHTVRVDTAPEPLTVRPRLHRGIRAEPVDG